MNNAQENAILPDSIHASAGQVFNLESGENNRATRTEPGRFRNGGLIHFFAELRRRRVCRAATLYAIAFWLICQVVELTAPELRLPEWTLRLVIVLGLLGFPIALVFSWLVDITPDGVVIDHDEETVCPVAAKSPRNPKIDCVIDFSLVLVALIIASQLAFNLAGSEADAASPATPRIAVLPFRAASGIDAEALSQGLVVELQHELASVAHATVIDSEDPYLTTGCLRLTGAISVNDEYIRVTATIVENKTGEVTWSHVFQQPLTDSLIAPAELARAIVAALPLPFEVSDADSGETRQLDHAS